MRRKIYAVADRLKLKCYSGKGNDNIIGANTNAFQFGDLRVMTNKAIIVVEVESAGGVTNFIKYCYLIEKKAIADKLILLHVYYRDGKTGYASHLELWDYVNSKIVGLYRGMFAAHRYDYPKEIEKAAEDFERLCKENSG